MTSAQTVTAPNFSHLIHLTDDTGVFEHALGSEPRPEHGYCVDDVARALVVLCRVAAPDQQQVRLARTYLQFTVAAVAPNGAVHNRMAVSGRWTDLPDLGDWWGRALWGLGAAVHHAPTSSMKAQALMGFRLAAGRRSPNLRSMAFAALGANEVLRSRPDEPAALNLLRDTISAIGPIDLEAEWPWPEPRLAYANGAIAEALLVAGRGLDDDASHHAGLRLLEFLAEKELTGERLSVTPVLGRGPRDDSPRFDQQPIEVACLADSAVLAFELTGDRVWRDLVGTCWQWFLGDNDSQTPMYDAATGAGFDGLQGRGRNLNQGAESTLAALSTALHADRLGLS